MPRPPLLKYGTCWLGSPVYFHYRLIVSFKNFTKTCRVNKVFSFETVKNGLHFDFKLKSFLLNEKSLRFYKYYRGYVSGDREPLADAMTPHVHIMTSAVSL